MVDTVTVDESEIPPPDRTTLANGDLVAARFRIKHLIAKGGMGAVYAAVDTALENELVALKTILPTIQQNATVVQRFRREVLYARKITHPNVCRVFDVGYHDNGAPGDESRRITFVTMEYLSGETLWSFLKRSGPLTPEQALPIVRQIAAGLGAAHSADIVHRDVKTPNVILVPGKSGPRAVVTDFGVACLSEDAANIESRLTKSGSFIGSPDYIAPEQLEGRDVTAATDVYAFGVVMYEMLVGKFPFTGSTAMAIAIRRLHEAPTPPRVHQPSIAPALEAVILRCLARNPEDRFQSTADVVRAIEDGSGEAAPTIRSVPKTFKPSMRMLPRIGILASILTLAAWLGFHKLTPLEPIMLRAIAENAYRAGDYTLARQTLDKAIVAGDADAQARAGSLWLLGLGGPCDIGKARTLLDAAAQRRSENGEAWLAYLLVTRGIDRNLAFEYAKVSGARANLVGRLALATAFETGVGTARDAAAADRIRGEALPDLRRRANQSDPFAENHLANFYRFGQGGLSKDEARAVQLYRKAADAGLPIAQNNLASMYEAGEGGLAKDSAKALELLQKAAERGDPKSGADLGFRYLFGLNGLSKNEARAAELFRKAADQGDAQSQTFLGDLYGNGWGGLPKDLVKAKELYSEAARHDYPLAQTKLGFMHQYGFGGLQKSDAKAVELYGKAASSGEAWGQYNLGVMYANGYGGLSADEAKAADLYAKAADQGNAYAQNNLGRLYELGHGGLKLDVGKAIDLYGKAAAQGHEPAKENLKRLGRDE